MALSAALALVVTACVGGAGAPPTDGDTQVNRGTQPPTSAPATAPPGEEEIPSHLRTMATIWETDFNNRVIDLNELLVGIPAPDPRDRIRPIDDPQFEAVAESEWLADNEPGVLIELEGEARFYPLSILTRHEIVNDTVGGIPVAVTYCPLCNTAVVFDRRFEGDVLRLGVSGLLRNSDLVMWDDRTQTLWQQVTGEGLVGKDAGDHLTLMASAIVRWADFRETHPDGVVLGPDQGFGSLYGFNPYEFYSSRERPYGFFQGEIDDRFPALERVVGVSTDDGDKAYPFSLLTESRVANDEIGGTPVVVFWGAADTADALDSGVIAEAAGIGTGVAYSPLVDGSNLTFEAVGDTEFRDLETGSTWSILGKATGGELAGSELALITHRNEFWFAWQAFFPDAAIWDG